MQEAANAAADRELLDRRRLADTRKLKLGQRVMHAQQGFRGLVCGWGSLVHTQNHPLIRP